MLVACSPLAAEMQIEPETLKMPLYRAFPLGLSKGLEVKLEGFIPQQSKGFHVAFLCGQYRGADVPFKFNLHFEGPPYSSSAIVTLNNYVNGQWGKETKMLSSLRQGRSFTIRFIITNSGYKITENDRVLPEFPHRIKPECIRFLQMDGEITLKRLVEPSK